MAKSVYRPKTRKDGTPVTLEWMRSVSIPEPNSGCWLWELFCTCDGYGRVHVTRGTCNLAHRVSYELAKGVIPDSFEVDHLCRVRCCINPDHLEAVPPAINYKRSSLGDLYSPPVQCQKGHAFNSNNPPIIKPGSRSHNCRICRAAIVKKWNDIASSKRVSRWTKEDRAVHMQKARAARLYKSAHS